jgi:peptidyl-prolyl cis-trans isomerase B (cyclophilin B)
VAPTDRQRAAARARLQREMAERAAAAQKRRRTQAIVAASVAALVVLIGVIWLIAALGGGDSKPSANATPTPAACKWNSLKPPVDPSASAKPSPLPSEIKDVGEPPLTGEPREGIEVMTINTNKGAIKINLDRRA